MIESKELESSYKFGFVWSPKIQKAGNKILKLSTTFIGEDHWPVWSRKLACDMYLPRLIV